MSKKPNIRWRKSDVDELQRVINNFNAKLYRIQKSNPDAMKYMPKKLTKKGVMSDIKTRQDYNTLISGYKKFTRRGAESIVRNESGRPVGTVWAKQREKEFREMSNRKKAKKKEELLKKPVLSRGQEVGYTIGDVYSGRKGMHSIQENQLDPTTKETDTLSFAEFNRRLERMKINALDSGDFAKMELFKENYIRAMIREGYSSDMVDYVRTLSPELMAKTVAQDEEAGIDMVYDQNELRMREDVLQKVWGSAINREKYSKNELVDQFKNTNLSDRIISSVIENSSRSDTEWGEILSKSGYGLERLKTLIPNFKG